MKRIITMLLALCLVCSVLACNVAAAEVVNFTASASTNNANVGDTITVTVAINALADGRGVQAALTYDSSKVACTGCAASDGDVFDAGSQVAFILEKSNPTALSGTMFTATFNVIAAGEISFDLVDCVAVSGLVDIVEHDVTTGSATVFVKCANNAHTYETKSDSAPSCTTDGVKKEICTECGHENTVITPAKGHTAGTNWETTKEPNCTDAGTKVKKCTVCSEVAETASIDALGHVEGSESITVKEATCTEKGIIRGKCGRCGAELGDTETKALGHVWDAGVVTKEPKCEVKGVKTFTCERGCTKTEDIAPTDHTPDANSVKEEPTCDKPGSITGKCAVCQKELEKVTIPALGHDWDDGTITLAPTCETAGVKEFVCNRNPSHTKSEEIPALGHTEPDWEITSTEHKGSCTVCGAKLDGAHDYRHEGGIVNGQREWKCACGAAIYKALPANDADLDDVPRTNDITGQMVGIAASCLAVMMAAAFVFKRKLAK